MSIPYNLSPLATHTGLPPGYTPLEFLQSAGAQYIDTQALNVFQYELDYTATDTQNNAIVAGYILPGKVRAFGIVEKNLVSIAQANGNYYRSAEVSAGVKNTVVYNANLGGAVLINGTQYATSAFGGKVLLSSPMTGDVSAYLFACNAGSSGAQGIVKSACLYSAVLKNKELTVLFAGKPVLDPTGTPCMFDTVTRQAFKNSGSGAFIAGVGTVAQLATVLSCLPSTGGKRTLSLPAEANTPEVAELLQRCHDTKGWTLTVHEYRPAAAATYSLRRVREVVWCRVAACEHGSYANVHGVRFNIERCVAIYGEHGQDPTDYGYEPFDSVEQAAEEWHLTPYIEPEMEEQS